MLIAQPFALYATRAEAPAQAATARDWSRAVVATPQGGYRMGNPAAKIKIVEFASLTCSHCEDFSREGYGPLVQKYVRRGTVSYELRNFVLNAYDLSAAAVANCASPQSYFPLTERLFATRVEWLKKFDAVPRIQMEAIEKMSPAARVQQLAAIGGLTAMAARFGVTPARAKACIANPKTVDKLMGIRRSAMTQYQIEGTPTFVINGEKAQATSWDRLEPLIRALGG